MKSNLYSIDVNQSISSGDQILKQCLEGYFFGRFEYFRRTKISFSEKHIIVYGCLQLKDRGDEVLTIVKIDKITEKIIIMIKERPRVILIEETLEVAAVDVFNEQIMLEKLNNMMKKWDLQFRFTAAISNDFLKPKRKEMFEEAFYGEDLETGKGVKLTVFFSDGDLKTIEKLKIVKSKTKNPV